MGATSIDTSTVLECRRQHLQGLGATAVAMRGKKEEWEKKEKKKKEERPKRAWRLGRFGFRSSAHNPCKIRGYSHPGRHPPAISLPLPKYGTYLRVTIWNLE